MKLIREIHELDDVEFVKESRDDGGKDYYLQGIFMQGEVANRNGRKYPMEILENEVNRYTKEYVERNRAYGELGHPNGPTINLDKVSHMIKEIKKDGTNFVGKAKIMDTPNGKIVKSLMDEGALLGVSSRGMGTLKEKNGVNEVQKDFTLATAADIVADPSGPNCYVDNVMEEAEWIYDETYGWRTIETVENHKKEISKGSISEERAIQLFSEFLKTL